MNSGSVINCDANPLITPTPQDKAKGNSSDNNEDRRRCDANSHATGSTIFAVGPGQPPTNLNGVTQLTTTEGFEQGNDSALDDGASTVDGSGSSRSCSPAAVSDVDVKPAFKIKKSIMKTRKKNTTASTSSGSSGDKRITRKQTQLYKMKKHDYRFMCSAKEDHGQPIFGCQFRHQRSEEDPLILATVGSNRISLYECLSDGKMKIVNVFADPDTEEIFYCCAWTEDEGGTSLLAAAGARGIIRIISAFHASCVKHYLGHGHSINDLTFHPKDPNLLLSASKDHSLRMYNIKTDYLVAIFGGIDGHRDEVLGADIDLTGSRIVSCGMDHSLKVWKLNKPEIEKAIEASYTFSSKNNPFPTTKQNFPDFSTRDVHRNYVDCTKWLGDFILSKSCENDIICWKAGKPGGSWDDVRMSTTETWNIHKFEVKDCGIWFIRFGMDYWKKVLALGNQYGKTCIYDLTKTPPSSKPSTVLSHPKCTRPIRQTALSRDGRVLVCVSDDATIWRWDINQSQEDNGAGDGDNE